jgi:rsbT antagonist protein RsbS
MSEDLEHTLTTTYVRGCLIVTFPSELATGVERAQQIALDRLRSTPARAAVLELSAVKYMDRSEFEAVRTLAEIVGLMGTRCVIVGLRPGVVAWLVGAEVSLDGLLFDHDLEAALERFTVFPELAPRSDA